MRELVSAVSDSGSHKDVTEKYRKILNKILAFKEPRLTDGTKVFIEAGKCLKIINIQSRWHDRADNFDTTTLCCFLIIYVLRCTIYRQLFYIALLVASEGVSLVVSRQIFTELCNQLPKMDSSSAKAISHFALEKLQPRVISFEEQVRLKLSNIIFFVINLLGLVIFSFTFSVCFIFKTMYNLVFYTYLLCTCSLECIATNPRLSISGNS